MMVATAVVFHHTFSVQKNEEDQIVQYKGGMVLIMMTMLLVEYELRYQLL